MSIFGVVADSKWGTCVHGESPPDHCAKCKLELRIEALERRVLSPGQVNYLMGINGGRIKDTEKQIAKFKPRFGQTPEDAVNALGRLQYSLKWRQGVQASLEAMLPMPEPDE